VDIELHLTVTPLNESSISPIDLDSSIPVNPFLSLILSRHGQALRSEPVLRHSEPEANPGRTSGLNRRIDEALAINPLFKGNQPF